MKSASLDHGVCSYGPLAMMIVARKTFKPGCDNTHDSRLANSTGQWNLRHRVFRAFNNNHIDRKTS